MSGAAVAEGVADGEVPGSGFTGSAYTARRAHSPYAAPPKWQGIVAALLVPPALTAVLDQLRENLNLTSTALLFLAAVVAVARLGGMFSALTTALWASLLLNYYFVSPLHSPRIADANDAIALAVFVVVALTVASVVDLAARQSRRAARANAEAATLNALSLAVLRGDGALGALLDQLRDTFEAGAVSLLQSDPGEDSTGDAAAWRPVATSGPNPPPTPASADTLVEVEPDAVLALRGRVLHASDAQVLSAFTAQATAALERKRLAESAAEAAALQAANKMRTALLAAVSHDLRSPLSAARTAVSTLADPELTPELGPAEHAELLEIAGQSLTRLTRLVEDLLDMSRLQAGALSPRLTPIDVHDVIAPALESLPDPHEARARVQAPEPATAVIAVADGPLLERVLANLLANAIKHTASPVIVDLDATDTEVRIRVTDHGPGIPASARDLVFRPFQRLGDRDNTAGVGLGLALARGLTESMGGTLTPEETPGGGLTMVVTLPAYRP